MTPHAAYRACQYLAQTHYENFPVASKLLPRRMRGPVSALYVFARRADDLADEGDATPEARLRQLDQFEAELDTMLAGKPVHDPLWIALADAIAHHDLPASPLRDLLIAFRQDAVCHRYATFPDLLAYCEHSANPVGRIMLAMEGQATPENVRDSDAICTALQLINFLQDLQQDFVERGRLYIPEADLAAHGVDEEMLRSGQPTPAVQSLLQAQIARAASLLHSGCRLPERLKGRFRLEIRLIIRGGWLIIERLEQEKPVSPFARPRLRKRDRLRMLPVLFGVSPTQSR